MLSAPPLRGPVHASLHDAAVGTGVGSLSGWGAAVLVITVLGIFAWWGARSSPRRRREEAMRREAKRHDGPPPGLDLRDTDLWQGRRRD